MRLSDVYGYDAWTALQHAITDSENRSGLRGGATMWCSQMGLDGVRYGGYRKVNNRYLDGRTYVIEWVDDWVSLYFLDVIFDPRTNKIVPLDDL